LLKLDECVTWAFDQPCVEKQWTQFLTRTVVVRV